LTEISFTGPPQPVLEAYDLRVGCVNHPKGSRILLNICFHFGIR
jgi:hypothetical protein